MESGGRKLRVGSGEVRVEIVETEAERQRGLSGRKEMGEDEGMLFVFDYPARHEFWMKEMLFDLDFVWRCIVSQFAFFCFIGLYIEYQI